VVLRTEQGQAAETTSCEPADLADVAPAQPEVITPPPPTRTREQREAAVVALRHAGATYVQITEAVDEHQSYVHRVLGRNDFVGQAPKPNLDRERRSGDIVRRRLAGQSYAEINATVGIRGKSTVHRVLARADLVDVDLAAEAKRRRAGRGPSAGRRGSRRAGELVARSRRIISLLPPRADTRWMTLGQGAMAVGVNRETVVVRRSTLKVG
jgi:hypothetical protein